MRIDENQKTQVIILCCLVVAVLAFGIYKVIGMSGHAGPSLGQQVSQTPISEQSETAQSEPATGMQLSVNAAVPKAKDPFTPALVPETQNVRATATPPRIDRTINVVNPGPALPPLWLSSLGGPQSQTAVAQTAVPREAPGQGFRLTGVIDGAVRVAIIRGADDGRYIVREGQIIDGRYVIESISRVGVRLRPSGSSQSILLKLGEKDTT